MFVIENVLILEKGELQKVKIIFWKKPIMNLLHYRDLCFFKTY